MKSAARITDDLGHGGKVATGDFTVLCEGLPLARLGDIAYCSMHGPGSISTASMSVFANGLRVSRSGDICSCGRTGAAKSGLPVTGGPGNWEWITGMLSVHKGEMSEADLLKKLGGRSLHFETYNGDTNRDGGVDTAGVRGSLGRVHLEDAEKGKLDLDFGYFRSSATVDDSSYPPSLPTSMDAEIGMARVQGEVVLGRNSTVAASGSLFSANAKYSGFVGDDGRRIGFDIGGGAEVSTLAGEVTAKATTTVGGLVESLYSSAPLLGGSIAVLNMAAVYVPPLADVLNTPVGLDMSASGQAGGGGGALAAQGYYDRVTEQTILGFNIGIEAILGVGLKGRLVIGRNAEEVPLNMGPNVIITGAPSVFVGD